MQAELNHEQAREFTRAYMEAWRLIEDLILIHGRSSAGRPGWWARRKLRKAIGLFERALEIHPGSWQSMWGLGKIYQRLGRHRRALEAFMSAHRLEPAQPDVAREAALSALQLEEAEEAIRLTEAAVKAEPDDPGLLANLALAHLLAGDAEQAHRHARRALERDPSDEITVTVHTVIEEVLAGERRAPRTLAELNESL